MQRIVLWLHSSFLLEFSIKESKKNFKIGLQSLRKNIPLIISVAEIEESKIKIDLKCDDMGLVGDIIQDLCQYLKVFLCSFGIISKRTFLFFGS